MLSSFPKNIFFALHKKIKVIFKSPFLKNVVVLAGGTAASQAIAFAFSPILTRLYGPEAYGIQGLFMTVVNIFAAVASLSYQVAIVLPNSDEEASSLSRLAIYVGFFASLALFPAFYVSGDKFLDLLNAKQISGFIYLIPPAVFISVLVSVATQWLIRKKEFVITSRVGVFMSVLTNSAKVGLGALYPSALMLIIINTVSGVFNSFLLYFDWKRKNPKHKYKVDSTFPVARLYLSTAAKYKDFPLIRMPQNLVNVLSQGVPIVFLSAYFGADSVGYYSIATAVLSMPSAVIGGSVMQVFYPRFNDAVHASENVFSLLLRATVGMAAVGIVPFGIFGLFGQDIFLIIFGQQWARAGEYCEWLSLVLFSMFINRPALSAISVMRKNGALLGYECISLILKACAIYIGFMWKNSDLVALATFAALGAVANIIFLCYALLACRRVYLPE